MGALDQLPNQMISAFVIGLLGRLNGTDHQERGGVGWRTSPNSPKAQSVPCIYGTRSKPNLLLHYKNSESESEKYTCKYLRNALSQNQMPERQGACLAFMGRDRSPICWQLAALRYQQSSTLFRQTRLQQGRVKMYLGFYSLRHIELHWDVFDQIVTLQ